jgi:hypothetical protein
MEFRHLTQTILSQSKLKIPRSQFPKQHSHQIIVEKHGGKIYCDSTPGQGTEFVVEIP